MATPNDVNKQSDNGKDAENAPPENDESTPNDQEQVSDEEREAENNNDEHEGESAEERLERIENELSKVRSESAKRRVQVRELSEKLAEAKTDEDIQTAVAEYQARVTELEHELLVTKVADKHNIPEALRDRLRGDTAEDLEKDAKFLVQLLGNPGVDEDDLRGGLDPSPDRDDDDAAKQAELVRRARRGSY